MALCWIDLGATLAAASTVVVVAPVGGPAANGAALLGALAGIAVAVPPPSASDPYLLKIEPGIYDVGATPVQMLAHVSIEGSGPAVTLIRGSVDSFTAGVVSGANDTELRLLTVQNTGGGTFAVAIHTRGSSMTISDVTARAGTATVSRAVMAQPPILDFNDEALTLRDVTAEAPFDAAADAVGVSTCCSARIDLENVTATGRTGLFTINREATARNSVFRGASQSVLVDLATANLVATRVEGPVVVGAGAVRCVAVHDGSFVLLGPDCQPVPPPPPLPPGLGKGHPGKSPF
jgi:hypothetical protein